MSSEELHKSVLIISFSLSGQTRKLIKAVQKGLENESIKVVHEPLTPRETIPFPFPSISYTAAMMIKTLFRSRIEIHPLSPNAFKKYDLVIIAGPTWSYNPSGPILTFFDRFADAILKDTYVLPLISCRGYWRLHWLGLKRLIRHCHGIALKPWAFNHAVAEPWRTIGVFLTLAGKRPKRIPVLRRFYTRYGHSKRQLQKAEEMAKNLGKNLRQNTFPH